MSIPDDIIRRIVEFVVDTNDDECPRAEEVLARSTEELWMRKKARAIYRHLRNDGFAMIRIEITGNNGEETDKFISRFIRFKEWIIPIVEERGWAVYIKPHGKSCIFHVRFPLPPDTDYHRRYHHSHIHV